jgi:general secretion pathway protein I
MEISPRQTLVSKTNKVKGFTLLEVLVALIFFALIGLVLQEVSASSVSQYLSIRNNTYATWIAQNKLSTLRVADNIPSPKEYKEDIEYGVDEWQVVTKVIATENPDIHRVEVVVFLRGEGASDLRRIRSLSGFVGRY